VREHELNIRFTTEELRELEQHFDRVRKVGGARRHLLRQVAEKFARVIREIFDDLRAGGSR
jgi:hypothetical protein